MRETKSSLKSQKQKPRSLKEEDLLLDSGTNSVYDGDSLSVSFSSNDSEDDGSTKDGDRESSVDGHEGSYDNNSEQVDGEENGSDQGSEQDEVSEESDEVAPRNAVGDVPLEWYKDEIYIDYDITEKKITKKEKQDKLESFLATMDNSTNWCKIDDEYNDEEVELTKEERKIILRILKGEGPHTDFDRYASYVDWFKWDDAIHPLSSAPERKRFIPSKWEAKMVIKFDKPEEEPLLWSD
ncbi:unnamed protein product [Arabidopsis arenosa]|uniref:BOP1 N-terminal domain-containing protein n=1 Tax=Arabidopsis arenosa TaxID=38785 RepID=A0A8S2ABD1_ARAAE|nr:unnamed protein product [Arabidopsis arenosa]